MNILFIGDIVGSVGREMVRCHLPLLKSRYDIDLVVGNGENAAHGKGITRRIYHQLISYGIDVMTIGNHTFAKSDLYNFIDEADRMVRPMNMAPVEYGRSVLIREVKGKRIAVVSLCGEIFMHDITDSPFRCMEDTLKRIDADIVLVDLHGEATSEKIAFAYAFAGRISAVVGTHTHVQTADERIIKGTAAISDLGMCGAYTSVLGRDVNEIVTRFMTAAKTRYTIAEGPGIFCGAVVRIDDHNNQAVSIERIQIRPQGAEQFELNLHDGSSEHAA